MLGNILTLDFGDAVKDRSGNCRKIDCASTVNMSHVWIAGVVSMTELFTYLAAARLDVFNRGEGVVCTSVDRGPSSGRPLAPTVSSRTWDGGPGAKRRPSDSDRDHSEGGGGDGTVSGRADPAGVGSESSEGTVIGRTDSVSAGIARSVGFGRTVTGRLVECNACVNGKCTACG